MNYDIKSNLVIRVTSHTRDSSNRHAFYAGSSKWDKIGTIVDIASLGTDIVSTTLDLLGSVQKKIVIQLGNAGGFDWEGKDYNQCYNIAFVNPERLITVHQLYINCITMI